MSSNRRKPFSGKQKKQQLQERNQRKRTKLETLEEQTQDQTAEQLALLGEPKRNNGPNLEVHTNKLRTVFEKEPLAVVEQRKADARKPIQRKHRENLGNFFDEIIDIPKRPAWTYEMTKHQVESNEAKMFEQYLDGIYSKYNHLELNYFEHNLEVWRQLWRVCEVSDVIAILADIRHPMFHFPPALYHYVIEELKKPLILILTKADLVPRENIRIWKEFFATNFPQLKVVAFLSFDKGESESQERITIGAKGRNRGKTKRSYNPNGVEELMSILNSFGIKKKGVVVDLEYTPPNYVPTTSKLNEDIPTKKEQDDSDSDSDSEGEIVNKRDDDDYREVRETSYVTLGLVGNPNVGKSTFVNAMKGRKVCSTSRTPGHTKWKQTIFLNENLMLCDCPGLIFPAVHMPKQLQILCGIFPIAQVREPYSPIQYLSQYIPLEEIYQLSPEGIDSLESLGPVDESKGEIHWSAFAMCEAYALKRGYRTKKGNFDAHRAGREILYDVIDGRIVLFFLPGEHSVDLGVYISPDQKLVNPFLKPAPKEGDSDDEDDSNSESGEEKEEKTHVVPPMGGRAKGFGGGRAKGTGRGGKRNR